MVNLMTQTLNFQSIIFTLQKFWADQGCLIWQPYYSQVGAGTMNPATALRVLGPEPWNVAYVEPAIRPDDARYGENPNRMQMHYQFQVILKPDPGNPQETYLRSLAALGIDLHQHDIRFVEDNWESPALGAWGLGWEVWLDGQEITQFTYFQQAGGRLCDPVSVEITYGLDRIAIALQRVNSFTEIRWDDVLTCGDVNLKAEEEHSKYYFEIADVGRLQRMYDLFEQEAEACLAQGLVLPAHDYLLKCSHNFNVLDARGAIGVTERQAYFGRMREISRRIAEAYLEQRQRLEYPFLKETGSRTGTRQAVGSGPLPVVPAPFLLEIGTEELPADDLVSLIQQLTTKFSALLSDLRLQHSGIKVYGTPRRLVVSIAEMATGQPDLEQVVKGPPASRAFDALGQPTPAAEGFARSKGIAVSDLEVREIEGGRYVTAVVSQKGRPAIEVLGETLPGLIASLRVDKAMRWNSSNVYFSRPIRWLLALFGNRVISFEYAGITAGNATRGMRLNEPETYPVKSVDDYFSFLDSQGIILDIEERRQSIQEQINSLAVEVDGKIPVDEDLLAEVTNLVEAPVALRGTFDQSHLTLPREVLISVMKKHQRYFPLLNPSGLMPYFIAVSNRGRSETESLELIIEGNEHVIRARFADAAFFVREDRKHPLESYLQRLGGLTFQTRLGSMLDKVNRIVRITRELAPVMGLEKGDIRTAIRAAELCKADLATHMVVEMTSLQGMMGGYYALKDGEDPAVATAIYEHYLPRYAGDTAPQNRPGLAVGVADRLDTLVGLFAAGLAPTGAKDPFAQRRAALGLVQALIAHKMEIDLRKTIGEIVVPNLPIEMPEKEQEVCLQFIVERLRNLLLDQGIRYDIVDAVLAEQGHNPARASQAVRELTTWVNRPDWHTILPAYARCVRITRVLKEKYPVNPEAFAEILEHSLLKSLSIAEATPRDSVNTMLEAFLPLIPVINQFFDNVLVMTEQPDQQKNRLGLLQRVADLARGIADFSRLEGF
jgi:glycyl-tRNA synthetase